MDKARISIDKITLVGKFNKRNNTLDMILIALKCQGKIKIQTFPTTTALNTYRHSVTLTTPEGNTLYLAYWWNGGFTETKSQEEAFKVEFNPNKDAYAIWRAFADYLNPTLKKISKFDIAIDLQGYTINDVYITTKAEQMHYCGDGAVTLYIAPKEKRSGRIKIYDKTKEQAKQGKSIPQTLRVEATAKIGEEFGTTLKEEELKKINRHLQDITLYPPTNGDITLAMLLYMPPYKREELYTQMAKATRAKYRALIRELTEEYKLPTVTQEDLNELLSEYQIMSTFEYKNSSAKNEWVNENQITTSFNSVDEIILKETMAKALTKTMRIHELRNVENDRNISCNH